MSATGLLTPTYWRDLESCELLCESVDRYVNSFTRHYLIVADQELPLFRKFNSARRVALPASQFLPPWLKSLPGFIQRNRRRYWWSFRSKPVSGWLIQQLLKIGAAATLPEQRYCILDSDVVLFRPFDLAALAAPNRTPLFSISHAIAADAPLHARWVSAGHRLLGLGGPTFPADDHIGHVIVWDQQAVRAMIARIEQIGGREWAEALCCERDVSEYLLYGYFVKGNPDHLAQHDITSKQLCVSYWDAAKLDARAIADLLDAADGHVAFSAASFSQTPIDVIRAALGKCPAMQKVG
jgi:hypothetical protein